MNKRNVFSKAEWIRFPFISASVEAGEIIETDVVSSAVLRLIGFGFFEAYINGVPVTDDRFLPLNTDFHERSIIIRNEPFAEVTAHRVYVSEFDVSSFLQPGKNSLLIRLYNGWYADENQASFGDKKLIYELTVTNDRGESYLYYSKHGTLCRKGFVTASVLTKGETQDYISYHEDLFFADDDWSIAEQCDIPETEYLFTDCPADRVTSVLHPICIRSEVGRRVYDIGKNTSGNAVLLLRGDKGDRIRLICSEEKTEDNNIDPEREWGQQSVFICDSTERIVSLRSTWNACRYFAVEGNAVVISFEEIHTDVSAVTSFSSNDPTIQWLADAFVNTQLSNMHSGIPSDCPHIERRGYTGDGQLACHASMSFLDAKKFYEKWIGDISDCQDRLSGHVQYTAPYTHSGGGPGGWGCAIVHVPYEFFRHYGDIGHMKALLPQMLDYFRFLDDHSENGLVVSDVPDEWCLGDWCTAEPIAIPAPFVNNYFYIRSINEILQTAELTDISPVILEKLLVKKDELIDALCQNYYDEATGDFCDNVQGANAFASDLGLGDDRTLHNLINTYTDKGMFDTGIFGTDILTRVLLEHGYAALAFQLLTSDKKYSFENIRKQGATTFWEYWTGKRSHSHPMFGAVSAYLIEFFCGVRLSGGKLNRIEPVYPGKDVDFACDTVVDGSPVNIQIRYLGQRADFRLTVPYAVPFRFADKEYLLAEGENKLSLDME